MQASVSIENHRSMVLQTDLVLYIFSSRVPHALRRSHCHVSNVHEAPPTGSYLIESLTDELCAKARVIIAEVEALGGMTKAIESGMPKLRIEEAAAKKQARIDSGEEVIVGVNKYRLKTQDQVDVLAIDNTSVREQQVARLKQIKATRDAAKVAQTLKALETAAANKTVNLVCVYAFGSLLFCMYVCVVCVCAVVCIYMCVYVFTRACHVSFPIAGMM